jgi:molybdate transport system substrate-binding protein
VTTHYDGSYRLLGQIKLTRRGDVYVAGDADYVEMAAKDGLIAGRRVLCHFVPVIMVAKGNPKGVTGLPDLLKPGMRIGQADVQAAAVGRLMPTLLERSGVDAAAWRGNVVMETPTVNELAIAVKLGTVDAAVVWDAVASSYPKDADSVAIAKDRNVCPAVEAAVLTTSRDARLAEAFLEFMASETGRRILRELGYTVEKP